MDTLIAPTGVARTRDGTGPARLPAAAELAEPAEFAHDASSSRPPAPPTYATRMRVVLLLSILSWLLVGLVVAWATGLL